MIPEIRFLRSSSSISEEESDLIPEIRFLRSSS
eukprot:COSAG01_NODE_22280_length_862_cov_6.879423_1_plen_32_part_10